jgi:hypothetical protein
MIFEYVVVFKNTQILQYGYLALIIYLSCLEKYFSFLIKFLYLFKFVEEIDILKILCFIHFLLRKITKLKFYYLHKPKKH